MRVVELLNGKAGWTRETIPYNQLLQGKLVDDVLNPQPIVDVDVSGETGESVHIPISEPVFRRLLKGRAQGLPPASPRTGFGHVLCSGAGPKAISNPTPPRFRPETSPIGRLVEIK